MGLGRHYFKQGFKAEVEKKRRPGKCPWARSSETVVTPLHGLEFGQAWVKKLKTPKTLQATENDAFQTNYLSLSLGILNACSFQ